MTRVPLRDVLELADAGVWGDEDSEGGISVLRSTNFTSTGTLDFSKLSFRAIDEKKRTAKTLRNGDILLEKSGGGPRQPVGRVCLFRGNELSHSFGNFIARLRPTERILSDYLFYFLWQFHLTGQTSQYQKQTTGIRNLETTRFLGIDVPVPPVPEQRRIVDILSRAESIVRLRREAQKKAAELIPALFLDTFGDPATNPKGWALGTLGQHVTIESAVRTPDHSADANSLCIGADSIESMTGKLITKPTVLDVLPISGKYWFEADEVVYSKIRPYLAKAALMQTDGYCSADMYPLRCRSTLRSPYLLALLLSKAFTDFATAESVRASMPKLNRKALFKYEFPVPPVELQVVFTEKFVAIQSIQTQQSTATTQAEATFNALLAQIFAAA